MQTNSNSNCNSIICGNALDELRKLPSDYVDCCITSPPYWALRDYKTEGQLGLEPTFQEYISKLVEIFDEVKRVLKPTGTCWVVMGDTYNTGGTRGGTRRGYEESKNVTDKHYQSGTKELPEKSLCKIPQRFEIAMIDHGWIERSDIIWYKPNCMPSSAKDRFTVDYEHVFFFVKSRKYYFETQYEAIQQLTESRNLYPRIHKVVSPFDKREFRIRPCASNPLGRIKRCVWKIPTAPFAQAHFATFPPALVEPMIKAGCPQQICRKCAKPTTIKYTEQRIATRPGLDVGNGKSGKELDPNAGLHNSDLSKYRLQIIRQEQGTASCDCNAGFDSGLVLDPFAGSGTTGVVAAKLARNFLGIEINGDYVEMAKNRLKPYLEQMRLQ
jgi:DNA modification methylase